MAGHSSIANTTLSPIDLTVSELSSVQGDPKRLYVPDYQPNSGNVSDGSGDFEAQFIQNNVANTASVFQSSEAFSKCIHWRSVHNCLEVSLFEGDFLSQPNVKHHASLRIHFPARIPNSCVGFSLHDRLTGEVWVHVLTEAQVLYTISLAPYLFGEDEVDNWCNIFTPSSFEIRRPFFLLSCTSTKVIFALSDGGILKLELDEGRYKETIFKDTTYLASLKGMLSWSGGRDDSINANLVLSMKYLPEVDCLATCSLNGTLKIWSLPKAVVLLNIPLIEKADPLLLPSIHPQGLIAYSRHRVSPNEIRYDIVTRAPTRDTELQVLEILISKEGARLVQAERLDPPVPEGKSIWVIDQILMTKEFGVSYSEPSTAVAHRNDIQLWILWKSNLSARLYESMFDLSSKRTRRKWSQIELSSDFNRIRQPNVDNLYAPEGLTEAWAHEVFRPGMFSPEVLQASCDVYASHIGTDRSALMTDVCASALQLVQTSIQKALGDQNYDDPAASIEATNREWQHFTHLCEHFSRLGNECLSLVCNSASSVSNLSLTRASGFTMLIPKDPAGQKLSQILQNDADFQEAEDSHAIARGSKEMAKMLSTSILIEFHNQLQEMSQMPLSFSRLDTLWSAYDKSIGEELDISKADELVETVRSSLRDSVEKALNSICIAIDPVFDCELERLRTSSPRIYGLVSTAFLRTNSLLKLSSIELLIVFLMSNHGSSSPVHIQNLNEILNILLSQWRSLAALDQASFLLMSRGEKTDLREDQESPPSLLHQIVDVMMTGPSSSSGDQFGQHMTDIKSMDQSMEDEDHPSLSAVDVCFEAVLTCLEKRNYHHALEMADWLSMSSPDMLLNGLTHLYNNQADDKSIRIIRTIVPEANVSAMSKISLAIQTAEIFRKRPESFYAKQLALSCIKLFSASSRSELDELRRIAFMGSLDIIDYRSAHDIMSSITDSTMKSQCCKELVSIACSQQHFDRIVHLPFACLQECVEQTMLEMANNSVESALGLNYYKVIFAWKMSRNDYQGAASALYRRLQSLRYLDSDPNSEFDIFSETTESYLAVISALACLKSDDAWILATDDNEQQVGMDKTSDAQSVPSRKLVTLVDVRKEYRDEMRRMENILSGQIFTDY